MINNIVSDIGEWDKTFQPNIRQYTVTVPSSANQISFTPFEMTFDIAQDTSLDTYTFTLEEGTEGIDGNGDGVSFGALEAKHISIVPKQVESIEIYGTDIAYEMAQYTAIVSPDNAVNKTVEWSVSDTNIAEISQEGLLTAKKNGIVITIPLSHREEIVLLLAMLLTRPQVINRPIPLQTILFNKE